MGMFLALSSEAQLHFVTATVTVTNTAGTSEGDTLTINGIVHTWRSVIVTANSDIQATNSIGAAATSLFNHLAGSSSFAAANLTLSMSGTNGVNLGSAPTVGTIAVSLSAGWGSIVLTTNTLGGGSAVRVPYTLEGAPEQTNITSGVVSILNA
ncbi:MAG TPA: hypothetical protein VHL11_11400, partial [Phototrophicaceae bacterium]|nr:hypothetical protein [Phototrophicaceae bacterium]